jgi:hypothetical protein
MSNLLDFWLWMMLVVTLAIVVGIREDRHGRGR